MAITLLEAKVGMADKVDQQVIDMFRRSSQLLDHMTFDNVISPGTGGSTLTYGYIQLKTPSTAAVRTVGGEFTPGEAKREKKTTGAVIMGGAFQVDRVLQNTAGAADEVAFQAEQKIKATANYFHNLAINGSSENGEFVFKEGTSVSGISISGKTMEEAKKLLEEREDSFIKPISISVDVDGEVTTLTQSDFEYTFDIDTVLSNIKNDILNPSGNTSETKTYEITATVTVDSIEKNTRKIEKATNCNPKNAYVSKFTPYSDKRFEYAEAVKGKKVNVDDLNDQIKTAVSQGADEKRIIADLETVDAKINVDDLKKNIKNPVTYI